MASDRRLRFSGRCRVRPAMPSASRRDRTGTAGIARATDEEFIGASFGLCRLKTAIVSETGTRPRGNQVGYPGRPDGGWMREALEAECRLLKIGKRLAVGEIGISQPDD